MSQDLILKQLQTRIGHVIEPAQDNKLVKWVNRVSQLVKRLTDQSEHLGDLVNAFFLHARFQYCVGLFASDMNDESLLIL